MQDGQVTVCRLCPAYWCDRYVRKALQSRTLLAWFLHSGFLQLFAGSIPEIAASLVKSTGVLPDATADSLTDTEKNDPIHGQVLFDSPVISIQESNNGEKVYVIDVEVQNCLSSARFLIGRSLQAAAAGMMEIRFVFVGENWRTYIENPEIRNFGLLFREPETDRRLAVLEEEYRLKGEALQKHEYSLRKKEENLRKVSEDLRRKKAGLEKQSRELEDRQQNMIRQLSRATGLSSVAILYLLNQE
ncbi:hypothetical protein [uncultured Faecalibaculum sp.]|uniref:hypothetical protein n=1 Tax=uncultured Faecalibaculum sp. TaxID=1729681 RepID=UPI0025CBA80F|nr:hypothetical protein [uncultured Faecalibaculum sp.]